MQRFTRVSPLPCVPYHRRDSLSRVLRGCKGHQEARAWCVVGVACVPQITSTRNAATPRCHISHKHGLCALYGGHVHAGTCERCGYIASNRLCKACVLLDGLARGQPRLALGSKSARNVAMFGTSVGDTSKGDHGSGARAAADEEGARARTRQLQAPAPARAAASSSGGVTASAGAGGAGAGTS